MRASRDGDETENARLEIAGEMVALVRRIGEKRNDIVVIDFSKIW